MKISIYSVFWVSPVSLCPNNFCLVDITIILVLKKANSSVFFPLFGKASFLANQKSLAVFLPSGTWGVLTRVGEEITFLTLFQRTVTRPAVWRPFLAVARSPWLLYVFVLPIFSLFNVAIGLSPLTSKASPHIFIHEYKGLIWPPTLQDWHCIYSQWWANWKSIWEKTWKTPTHNLIVKSSWPVGLEWDSKALRSCKGQTTDRFQLLRTKFTDTGKKCSSRSEPICNRFYLQFWNKRMWF